MARIPYRCVDELAPSDSNAMTALSDGSSDDETTVGDEKADDDSTAADGEIGVRNVYQLLGHEVALLEGFRTYFTTLWEECGLSPADRELAILATAFACRSRYV
jgi:hypothetical protein